MYPFTYKVSARSPAAKMGRTVVTRADGVKKPEMAGRPGSTVTAHPPEQRRIARDRRGQAIFSRTSERKGLGCRIRRVHAPEWTAPRPSTRRADSRLCHRLRTTDRLRRNFSRPRAGVRMPVAGRAPRSGATIPTPVSRPGVRCRTQGHEDQTPRRVTVISGSCPDPSPPDLR